MEPRIQYAKTSDGVSIAYSVTGEAPPVILTTSFFGDLHLLGQFGTAAREWAGQLAALSWKAIKYDMRGCGLSDRDCEDLSLDARVRDMEAVISRAAPAEPCAIVAYGWGGPTAITYTAQNPERVSSLVLRNTYANGAERDETVFGMLVARGLRPIAEKYWEFFTLTLANALVGFTDSERARRSAEAFRSGMSPQGFLAATGAMDSIDASPFLGSIEVPCLVVNDTGVPIVAEGARPMARKLASSIPNARLVETDNFIQVVDEFLREGLPAERQPELPSGTAIILFADIADSTGLTERLGDAAFRAKARELGPALRALVRECGGTPVEGPTLGDGVLAVFTSAREAIQAAQRCAAAGDDAGLPLHLGLHAGDVTREKDPDGRDNVYGGAVNIASRISGLSAAGEVLVSETVRSLARTSAGVVFEDRGEQALKGVGEKVRVWAVRKGGR
jgi:class 3 adenylate cyclase